MSKRTISIQSFLPLALSFLYFCSTASATPPVFPAEHAHAHGISEQHHHFHHFDRSTTPVNLTIIDGKGHIKQFGNVIVIWISSPNAIVQGNLSTNIGDIVKVFMKAADDTTVLESNTGFATYANGHYYSNATLVFLNSAGFVFGPSSQVKAANVVISTLNINNADLLSGLASGKYNFTGQGTYIINEGQLIAKPGGYVALLSGAINNQGTINAKLGKIVLASGDGMTLTTVDLDDNSTIFVAINQAIENEILGPDSNKIKNAIDNSGTISANGGTIVLTAKSLNKIFDYSINNTGIIEANSLSKTQQGDVVLKASGAISTTGTLQTSALFERGSTLQVGGVFNPGIANIKNADNALVYTANTDVSGTIEDAVNIIIDPNVILTMTGDTNFTATSGSFLMDPSASINGGGYNLTITAADDVDLGNINNVNTFTATATSGNLMAAAPITSKGNIRFIAGQDIVQDSSIDTTDGGLNPAGGNYTATAGSNYILNDATKDVAGIPAITTGNTGLADIYAPNIEEIGFPGSSNFASIYNLTVLGGFSGYTLVQYGYYFSIGNTLVYVPSLSPSDAQTFVNIDNIGDYIYKYTNALGAPWGTPNTYYLWYSDPALNADNQNHVITVSASDEANWLIQNNAFLTPYSNLIPPIPGGTIYNWDDAWNDYNRPGQYFNDSIIESTVTTTNALIVTANNQSMVYGSSSLPTLNVNYAGFVNGDTSANLTTLPTEFTTATTSSNAGNYTITASGAVDPNYSIFYVPGSLTITPAPLTITATGPTKPFGTTLTAGPSATDFTTSGTVNNQIVTSVTLTPDANGISATTPAGSTYSVTPSDAVGTGGFLASNYSITYDPYIGTVGPVALPQGLGFNAFGVLITNTKVNKIIYETLSTYQLSTNTVQQPLVYFYHPLTPIDQSAFDGISLDEGAYDFIQNSLELHKAPAAYYGVQ